MTRPGTFSSYTPPGANHPHLRIDGANGEPVAWSEVYSSGDAGVRGATEMIVRTVLDALDKVLANDEGGTRGWAEPGDLDTIVTEVANELLEVEDEPVTRDGPLPVVEADVESEQHHGQ